MCWPWPPVRLFTQPCTSSSATFPYWRLARPPTCASVVAQLPSRERNHLAGQLSGPVLHVCLADCSHVPPALCMSYARYLAICHPFTNLPLGAPGCVAAWPLEPGSVASPSLPLLWPCQTLCCLPSSRAIDHYFCDFAPVVGLFFGEVGVMCEVEVSISGFRTLALFLLIVASYSFI